MSDFFDKLKMFFSSIDDFLMPFIKQFLTAVGPIVLAAAEKAVVELAAQSMTGAQKNEAAYQKIVDDLRDQSIVASASLIKSSIEVAVPALKEKE